MSNVVSTSVAGAMAIAVLWTIAPATQSKSTLKVPTGRGQVGYDVNSTHAHPDHLFGFAVLRQAFPEAKIIALPATVNAATTSTWSAARRGARQLAEDDQSDHRAWPRHRHSRPRGGWSDT